MRSILFKMMLAIVCVAMSKNVYAYDLEVDGIYYNIVSTADRTCEVTYKGKYSFEKTYSGVLTIPETIVYNTQTITVVGIGYYAFYNDELTEVNLPSTLTTIGDYAFSGCSSLANIILPQSLNSIGNEAFSNCTNITDIVIPKSVTKIGTGILKCCSNLKSVIVDSENMVYDSRENCNAVIHTATNELIAGCSTTFIPETVTALGRYCLSYRELPKVLNISKQITKIDWNAFEGCYGTTELIIEDSTEPLSVYLWIFNLNGLSTAYIGRDLLYNWGESLFSKNGVACIENVTFGSNVTFIHSGLFKDCKSLKKVTLLGEVKTIGEYAFYNSTGEYAEFNIPYYNSITIIETYAFANACLSGFKLSENLTKLGTAAFAGCKGLSSELTIPKSLEKLETSVFNSSSGVSKLIIPNTVLEIGARAFYNMADLAEVVIEHGDTPLYLGEDKNIFSYCPIRKAYIDREMEYDDPDDPGHQKFYACPFAYNKLLEDVIIGNNIKSLKESYRSTSFYMCENLKYLDLGNQLESFSYYGSFSRCENITRIYSRNPIPPANALFETKVYMNAEVKVPKGSLAAYQADENWRNFWNIAEVDFSGVDSVDDDNQSVVDVYNLQGVCVRKGVQRGEATQGLPQGIYIINGEKVLVK